MAVCAIYFPHLIVSLSTRIAAGQRIIVNIYAPNDRAAHLPFWNRVDEVRQNKGIPKPDFVLGDFNVTEEQIDRFPARLDDQNAIEALRDLRHAWEVHDAWRVAFPSEKTYTYRANTNGGQIKSRLDRIYVARQATPMTYDWKITPSPVPTNHWLVAVKYAPKDAPEIGKGRWTLPIRMLNDAKLIEAIIARGIRLQNDLEDIKKPTDRLKTIQPSATLERLQKRH